MRSVFAAAALLGLLVVSGCDVGNLDATDRPASTTDVTLSTRSAGVDGSASATGSAKPKPSGAGSTATRPPTRNTSTPSATAVATDTANAGTGSTAGVPTSYAAASSRITALHGARRSTMTRFTTTGDAVYCVLKDRYIPTSCELGHGAVPDASVCGRSMADAVGRIQLGDDGAVPECNSDTIREPGAKVVAAPAVILSGNLECAVEKIGVTCVNTRTKAGFFLTPGKYATFSS